VKEVKREVISLRENRLVKQTKADRRKTISREEKLTIGSAKGGEIGKNTDLGRKQKPLRFRQVYVIELGSMGDRVLPARL
jgi:hypothetical protein